MIVEVVYKIITKIYSIIFSYIENIFLKKKTIKSTPLIRLTEVNIKKINYNNFLKIKENKYLTKIIFPEDEIFTLIRNIFKDNNLTNKITKLTGFNYTVNFFTAYETFSIMEIDKDKSWYANHFHIDKPFSKNMIKLFFSFEDINEENGPMIIQDNFPTKATIKKNEIILFYPSKYYHKAGSPKIGSRFMMMLQLNPSVNWRINKNIYYKQKQIEPKFPFFTSFNDKKINL